MKDERAGASAGPFSNPKVRFLHHPAHVRHAAAHTGAGLLRSLGNDCLGGEDVLRDRRCVLQRRARDHRRVADPALQQVLDLARVDVQTEAGLRTAHVRHCDRALEARVRRELAERLLERANDDLRARRLVAFERVEDVVLDRVRRVDERDAAARDLTLLERRASGLESVLDTVLLLLHLGLGRRADLDDRDAARQLREALLELLAVEVRIGRLDLRLDLLDAGLDRVGLAGTVDDRRRVLVDDDAAGLAELRHLRVLELEAHLLGDHLGAREDRDVLEHPLAAIAEARRLDGDGLEGAAQLVDDDRRERLALDVLRHDQQRATLLDDLLEYGQEILDGADLLVGDEDVRLLEHRLHPLGVRDHVRREVALVELHALGELELEAKGLALLDVHDTVLADLLDGVGDYVADLAVARGDGRDARDVFLARHRLRALLQMLDDGLDRRLDAALEPHRVRTGRDVLEAFADDRLREHGRRGGAVAGDVVGRRGDLAHELRALVLEDVLDLDLAGDRDAVIRDGRCAELLVEHDVPALRAKGDLDRVGEGVHAALKRPACILVELQLFVSHIVFSPPSELRGCAGRLASPDDLGENIALAQDQVLVHADLDLGAAVLGEDDLVALLQIHGDKLSVVVPAARADGKDAAALRLLLGRIRKHDAAARRLLFLEDLDDQAVTKRLQVHSYPPGLGVGTLKRRVPAASIREDMKSWQVWSGSSAPAAS